MKFLSIFLLTAWATVVSAQTPVVTDSLNRCGVGSSFLEKDIDPKLLLQMKTQWESYARQSKGNGRLSADDPVLVVPVMFHIAHRGEGVGSGANVSEGQIQAALANLNNIFRARGKYTAANDTRIEFVLANCAGIDRANASGVPNFQQQGVIWSDHIQQQQVKALFGSYQDKFVNIYVSHTITGAGGFASFGGDMFITASEFPRAGSFSSRSLTFAHEMGHCLFLHHTFQGDNSCLGCSYDNVVCPTNDNPATQGDQVADTPPHRVFDLSYNTSTNANNPCTGEPFSEGLVRNHMAYYNDSDRFTPGQVTRMRFFLENFLTRWLNSDAITTPNNQLSLSSVPSSICANSTVTLGLTNNSGSANPVLLLQKGYEVVHYVEVSGNLVSFDFPGYLYAVNNFGYSLIPGDDYQLRVMAGCNSKAYGGIQYKNISAYEPSVVGANNEPLPRTFREVYADVCAGSTLTLKARLRYIEHETWQTVSPSDLENFGFQWTLNEAPIADATNSSYGASGSTGNYRYRLTDPGCPGQSIISNAAQVNFNTTSNSYTSDYADGHFPLRTQCSGSTMQLSASYVSNSATYSWYRNDVLLPDATSRTMLVTTTGTYRVVPNDPFCTISIPSGDGITVNFGNALENFLSAPVDSLLCGRPLLITGAATGDIAGTKWGEGLDYQWLRNGVEIQNATSYFYQATQEGTYSLRLKQRNCESVSEGIRLYQSNQEQKPVISAPKAFANGLSYYLSMSNPDGNQQWYKDGQPIQGAYDGNLKISTSGVYTVRKGYGTCAIDSDPITANFGADLAPTITTADSLRLICNNLSTPAILQFDGRFIENSSSLSYRWMKDGSDLPLSNYYADKSFIQTYEDGVYRLRVSSGSASGTSNPITVSSASQRTVRVAASPYPACTGNIIKLTFPATSLPDPFLIWKKDGFPIPDQHRAELIVLQSGSYTATYQGDGCSIITEPIQVTVANENLTATLSGNSAIRAGESADLLLQSSATGFDYFFRLSDGSEYKRKEAPALIPKSPNLSTTYTLTRFGTHCGLGNTSGVAHIDVTKCPAGAVNYTLASGFWDTPSNWSCGSVPTVLDPVRISPSHTIYLPSHYEARSKSIELAGKMQQDVNSNLQVGQ